MFFFVWQLISIYGNILWFACQVNPGYWTTSLSVADRIQNYNKWKLWKFTKIFPKGQRLVFCVFLQFKGHFETTFQDKTAYISSKIRLLPQFFIILIHRKFHKSSKQSARGVHKVGIVWIL